MPIRFSLLLLLVFGGLLSKAAVSSSAILTDSLQYKIISLDSLSNEDLALLEEYKDSFLFDLKEIQSALIYKKKKPIDTTVALMNRSSHCEIGLNVSGPIVSSGRKIEGSD